MHEAGICWSWAWARDLWEVSKRPERSVEDTGWLRAMATDFSSADSQGLLVLWDPPWGGAWLYWACWFSSLLFPKVCPQPRFLHAFPSVGYFREEEASDENPALLVHMLPSRMAL